MGDTFENRAPLLAPAMNGVFLAPDGTGVSVGIAGAVALRDGSGWHLQDPAIATSSTCTPRGSIPTAACGRVGGELTTSLNQGVVAYGGDAQIPGTID